MALYRYFGIVLFAACLSRAELVDERFKAPGTFPIYVGQMNERFTMALYWDMDVADPKPGFMTLYVTPGMSVRNIINMANFYDGKPYVHTELTLDRKNNPWRDDGGKGLHDRSVLDSSTRLFDSGNQLFHTAHYGGRMLNPDSLLRDAGIRDQSMVFMKTLQDNMNNNFQFSRKTLKVGDADEKVEVYDRAPVRNLYNQICEKTGKRRGTFAIQGEDNTYYPVKPANHKDVDAQYKNFWRMHAWKNHQHSAVTADPLKFFILNPGLTTDVNTLLASVDFLGDVNNIKILDLDIASSNCRCLTADQYAREAHFIPKKMRKEGDWGKACKAHDMTKSYCSNPKKREKGDRECWCPLKWCYTTESCGEPSKTTPGLFYSYDLPDCNNNDVEEAKRTCYTTDDEGSIDQAELTDFDLWNFEGVVDYLQALLVALTEAVPDFNDHLSD